MAKYTAKEVAHYIVDKCAKERRPISNLQLQKILYFVQCEYIKLKHDVLFDDDFAAWQHGPVIPSIYREYSLWGSNLIVREYDDAWMGESDKKVVDPVVDSYREKSPWSLVNETHQPGSPWSVTFDRGRGMGNKIDLGLIVRSCG